MPYEINRLRIKLTQFIYIKSKMHKDYNIDNDFIITDFRKNILDRLLKGK